MKFIPKYQSPSSPIIKNPEDLWMLPQSSLNYRNFIKWNWDKWVETNNDSGKITLGESPFKGGDASGQDLYKYVKRGNYLENNTGYKNLLNAYFNNDGSLTSLGLKYIDLYIENSKKINGKYAYPWMDTLLKFKNNNYTWSGNITKGGQTYGNWRDFILGNDLLKLNGVATDFLYALGHNVTTGDVYFYRDKDGNIKFVNPDTVNNNDLLTDLSFALNLLNDSNYNHFGLFVNFHEIGNRDNALLTNKGYTSPPLSLDDFHNMVHNMIFNPGLDPKKYNPETKQYEYNTPSNINGVYDSGEGNRVGGSEVSSEPGRFRRFLDSVGRGFKNIGEKINVNTGGLFGGVNGERTPAWSQAIRTAIDNAFNTANTEKLIKGMDVSLNNYTPVYRLVHGDYVSQQLALREAARLRNSLPLTSNAQLQSAADLEAILKGNLYIEQGNAKDAQMFWNTSEQAFQLAKENARGWDTIANANREALTNFNNKIAELRYETRKQNMQNWDTYATDMETRAWDKYNRDEAKRIQAREEMDTLYDALFGLKDVASELKLAERERDILLAKNVDTNDPNLQTVMQRIARLNNIIVARLYYNKLNRYGQYDSEEWKKLYGEDEDYNFDNPNWTQKFLESIGKLKVSTTSTTGELGSSLEAKYSKFGGIINILQKGGGFGVVAASSAGKGNPYLLASAKSSTSSGSTSKSSTSSSDDDNDDKTRDKLLGNIAETIKGIDGLNSDVNVLYNELTSFFDVQRYSSLYGSSVNTDPMQFYSMYMKALNRVNLVKQSAKLFDGAYKELEKRNAMTSPAIDSNGYVFVGIAGTDKIERVTPNEYLKNTKKYQLLRNNELLDLRRNNPQFAFSDKYITEVAYNGTNIQDIHKYIKEVLGKVGSDKESQDVILKLFGSGAFEGLQTLSKLASGLLSQEEASELIKSLSGTMTEVNVSTLTQMRLAKLALDSIMALLPLNMRSLLLLHAGSPENVGKLLTSFIAQGLDTSFEFKVNGITQLDELGKPVSGTRASGSGSGDAGSGKIEDPKTSTATKWVQGYGATTTFQIVGGGNKGWTVSGNTMPVTDNSDKQLGQATLLDLSSGWGGTLNLRYAYMGNSRISSLGLSQVLLEDGDITLVALPISNQNPNKPAFERFKKLSEAESILKGKGIDVGQRDKLSSDLKKIVNEVYKLVGLDPLFNNDGSVNKLKFGYFGLIKGIAKETAFEEGSEFTRDYLIEATSQEKKLFEEIMKSDSRNKGFSISNGFLGIGADNVYRGTIFIPVNTNIMNTLAGYGSSYASNIQGDYLYDTLQQKHDAEQAQGGAHPDKVSSKRNFQFE